MIVAYHLIAGLLLILVQTTLLAAGTPANMYDLLAPLVVYLGIYRSPREAVPVLILAGLAVDGLSGGVFGIHLTCYLWLYVGVRWAVQFLHVGNVVLLPLLVVVGITFESVITAFGAVVLAAAPWPVEAIFPVISRQVLWGLLTGPVLILGLIRGHEVVLKASTALIVDGDAARKP